jgi:hypothetical protein
MAKLFHPLWHRGDDSLQIYESIKQIAEANMEAYENLLKRINTPYAELAQKMLKIVDELRNDNSLDQLEMSTAMMTLVFKYPKKSMALYVDWDFDTKSFEVYQRTLTDRGSWNISPTVIIDNDDKIIPYIREELNRMLDLP